LKALKPGFHPGEVIATLSENLLEHYSSQPLIDRYDVYQHLMDYWTEVMQDDCFLITTSGWKAETYRILEKDKKGEEKDKGWTCDLIPKELLITRYFSQEQSAIDSLRSELENVTALIAEMEEEESGDDGLFAELEKINKAGVTALIKENRAAYTSGDEATRRETIVLESWVTLSEKEASLKKQIKEAEADMDSKVYIHYPRLSEEEIKDLVVNNKWMIKIEETVFLEIRLISQSFTDRVKELSDRYNKALSELTNRVQDLESKVYKHLEKMGFEWL
jgi:type I restriction enzyme M protein